MKKKVSVSRSGLTRCPTCRAHIRLAEEVAETACPFCHAHLFDDGSRSLVRRALDAVTTGRGSLIATTLAGALAIGGCTSDSGMGSSADGVSQDGQTSEDVFSTEDGGTSVPDIQVFVDVPETPMGDVYGAPPLDVEVTQDVPETPISDVYGAPPLDVEITQDVPETPMGDVYGAPPLDTDQ